MFQKICFLTIAFLVMSCSSSEQSRSFAEGSSDEVNSKLEPAPLNWDAIIAEFGGVAKDSSKFPATAAGFVEYARLSGVKTYDPLKMITPPNQKVAKKCKIQYLLPERAKWKKGIAIALWAEELGKVAGEQPNILNWYRPPCYNQAVGGAKYSDHMAADSADLDFNAATSRRRAQAWLCDFWKSKLNMQIGLGDSMVHLGAMSPRGKRNWYYESYVDKDRGKTCFDKVPFVNTLARWFDFSNGEAQPLYDEDSNEDHFTSDSEGE